MALEYTRYTIELRPRSRLVLPEFAGSLVRGTFGRALRDLACATRAPECTGCPVAAGCVYREVFDPLPPASHGLQRFSAIPAPYVLHLAGFGARACRPGQTLSFAITLLGRSRRHLPLVILAIQRAAALGWTRDAVQIDLHRVIATTVDGECEVLQPGGRRLVDHGVTRRIDRSSITAIPASAPTGIDIELITPTRLQQDGRPARPNDLQARTWLMALVRRIALLADFHGEGSLGFDFPSLAEEAEQVSIARSSLHWQEWERYSGRQKSVMPMGGLVGPMHLRGSLDRFLPLLAAGRDLHVGKHAAFGLGAFVFSHD